MEVIVSQYRKPLLSFFRNHAQNYWDAEELVQEVFCKLLKGKELDESRNQEAYLYTIAWNVLRDKARADQVRRRDSHLEFDEELATPVDCYLEQTVDSHKLYQCFLNALEDLPPKTRHVFILNRYENLKYRNIAERYGITVSQIEKHMIRALASLRKAVDNHRKAEEEMAGKHCPAPKNVNEEFLKKRRSA